MLAVQSRSAHSHRNSTRPPLAVPPSATTRSSRSLASRKRSSFWASRLPRSSTTEIVRHEHDHQVRHPHRHVATRGGIGTESTAAVRRGHPPHRRYGGGLRRPAAADRADRQLRAPCPAGADTADRGAYPHL